MRLENTYRFAPRALATILLSTALFNCSSTDAPSNPPAAGGAPGSSGATSTAGSAANVAGGAASGAPDTGGAGATGGATATAGASASGASSGGASGAGTSGGAGGAGGGSAGGSVGGGTNTCPTVPEFATWPDQKGPLDIGKSAVGNFKGHTGDDYGGAGYAWTFAYTGALQFTKLTGDTASNATLISGFERYASGATAPPSNTATSTVDDRAFGVLPLEIYVENKDQRCLKLGLDRADMQWVNPTSDGITKDARYWADDMFMITALQVYAYRATKDQPDSQKYLTRSALT
ncbi:MAG: hypothetical protein ABW061_10140, partial [Polyangiaceae bacterium]